jgi:hypothetical protein
MSANARVDAGELDPGLNGQLGHRVGQQMALTLGADKLLARRRGISPVRHRHQRPLAQSDGNGLVRAGLLPR